MIGLVLAGGGAKGAYQVGAWQALREQGIEIDVITGTSIGALNAALFAADDLDKARSFWRSLSTTRLARIEPLLLLGLPLRPLGLVARGSRSPQNLTGRQLRSNVKFGAIIVLLLLVLAVITSFVARMSPATRMYLVADVIAFGVFLLLPDISELVNGSLISRRALFSLIDESIDWAKVAAGRPSVFVTLARLAHQKYSRKMTMVIPDYARLSLLEASVARACLTASMALPFGIFPRIEVGNARYMDGGVADNTPLYPAVLEQCNRIYVVHLSPKPRHGDLNLLDDEQLEASLEQIDRDRAWTGESALYMRNWWEQRLKIVARMREVGVDEETIQTYTKERYALPGDGNTKIIHIVPRTRLGWGLFGTLIFNRRKTERLMAMGYEDAKATLAGLRPVPASPSGWRERRAQRAFRRVLFITVLSLLISMTILCVAIYLSLH